MREDFNYGGQAVIEGVMMRGRESMAIAVRRSKDDIVVHHEPVLAWARRVRVLRLPLIRGVLALIEAMVVGVKALSFSASQFAEAGDEEIGTKEMVLTVVLALALTVGVFVMLPAFLIRLVQAHVDSNILLNLLEGLIKITLFVLYILLISLLGDIRRVFQYHGAEHKAINCLESGKELAVHEAEKFSTVHARCGTSFLLIVLFTSILFFSFFGRPPFIQRVLIHLALLPLVAGVAYEIIKAAGRKNVFWAVRAIAAPGLWLQRLTTREPDRDQVEVAVQALRAVMDHEARARVSRIGGEAGLGQLTPL